MKIIKNRAGVTLVEVMASVFVTGITLIFIGMIVKMGLMKYRELRAYDDLQRNSLRILASMYKGVPVTSSLPHIGNQLNSQDDFNTLLGLQSVQQYFVDPAGKKVTSYYTIPERDDASIDNSSYSIFSFVKNGNESGLIRVEGKIREQLANESSTTIGQFSNQVAFPVDERNTGIPFEDSSYETDEDINDAEEQDESDFEPYKFIIEDCDFEFVKFNGSRIFEGSSDYTDMATQSKVRRHDGIRVTLTCLYRYPTLNPFNTQLRTRRVQFEKIVIRNG